MAHNVDLTGIRINDKDTGSSDVQVAIITKRIADMTAHLQQNPKDVPTRRSMLKLVARRRRHLEYLKRTAAARYEALIAKLGLRR